jgi:hypothetical protein
MIISGNTAEVSSAFVKAISEMDTLIAEKGKGNFGNKYVELADLLMVIKPILAANGLSVSQEPMATEDGVGVATTILHSSGSTIEFVPLVIALADRKPHTVGSAVTYAKRYALAAIFGLEGGDDDDGQEAQDSFKQKPKVTTPVPAPTNGTSHHARPASAQPEGDDELWDTPATHAKTPNAATPAQVKRADSLGVKMYGTEAWSAKMPAIAEGASTGNAKTLEALKDVEIEKIIAGLEKRINERAAQLQAAPSPGLP